MTAKQRGDAGERFARTVLEDKGMRFIGAKFRAGGGEIDLIMRDGEYTAFVEVKLRTSCAYSPVEAVTPDKRRRISNAAAHYAQRMEIAGTPMRFDVVGIQRGGEGWEIEHIPHAFEYCGEYCL